MDKYWIMQDGTEILIGDMGNSHIINCIRMLNGRFLKVQETLKDLGRQGRVSRPGELYDSYDDLVEEANKRKLRVPAPKFATIVVRNKPYIEDTPAI